ncbi:radical SAM/SPASM domain-containing protein [Nibricoccus sp. IMCC34717]|uniref:radical SAM/SPASM domain-containing protein n=1 Tax=Nibricoccus sp. IMCC34717 TaxID=3034021 RepID=UPI00384D23A1
MSSAATVGDSKDLALKEKLLVDAKLALSRVFTAPGLTDAKRLELAKAMNAALQNLELQMEKAELSSFPTAIELPVAGKCNLRCTMCSLSHGAPTYPNWTIEEVERFEPLFRYAQNVNPTGVGEPLSVKDLPKMLALFKRYALVAGFYSNGTLLTPERTEMLLDSNLTQLNISLDGATKETYERIRRHGSFDQVIANLKHFVRRRNERGLAKPLLQVAMVLMRQNMNELPLMVQLAHEIGANSIYTMYEAGVLKDERCELEPERTNKCVEQAKKLARDLGIWFTAPAPIPVEPQVKPVQGEKTGIPVTEGPCKCMHPWFNFLVHNDGRVGPCCRIKGAIDGFSFGRVDDADPVSLWNSPGMIHLRQRLASNDAPEVCRTCNIRTLKIN